MKSSTHRGAGSTKSRKRGGTALQQAGGDEKVARQLRLRKKTLQHADVHTSANFSITADSNSSSTGWHGRLPPVKDHKAILQAYINGSIKELMTSFHRVFYDEYATLKECLFELANSNCAS